MLRDCGDCIVELGAQLRLLASSGGAPRRDGEDRDAPGDDVVPQPQEGCCSGCGALALGERGAGPAAPTAADVAALHRELSIAAERVATLSAARDAHETAVAEATAGAQAAQRQAGAATERVEGLRAALASAKHDWAEDRASLGLASEQLGRCRRDAAAWRRDAASVAAAVTALQHAHDAIATQLRDALDEVAQLRTQLAASADECDELRAHNRELRDATARQSAALTAAEAHAAAAGGVAEELQVLLSLLTTRRGQEEAAAAEREARERARGEDVQRLTLLVGELAARLHHHPCLTARTPGTPEGCAPPSPPCAASRPTRSRSRSRSRLHVPAAVADVASARLAADFERNRREAAEVQLALLMGELESAGAARAAVVGETIAELRAELGEEARGLHAALGDAEARLHQMHVALEERERYARALELAAAAAAAGNPAPPPGRPAEGPRVASSAAAATALSLKRATQQKRSRV